MSRCKFASCGFLLFLVASATRLDEGSSDASHIEVELISERIIIVGAGTSACALVRGLADRGIPCMVIDVGEGGGNGHIGGIGEKIGEWPKAAATINQLSESYETEPQVALGGRRSFLIVLCRIEAFRGKGLGGTANVNAGLWQRGRREDYRNWPWAMEKIEKAFNEVERKLTISAVHAKGFMKNMVDMMVENNMTKREARLGTWTTDGVDSPVLVTHNNLTRVTPWTSLVEPVLNSGLVKVATGTRVIRIVIEDSRAVGVLCERRGKLIEFRFAKRGESHRGEGEGVAAEGSEDAGVGRIRSSGEVVLSSGVFESPKLLMLSGIGPKHHLQEMGIRVVQDLPAVGEHMLDHTILPVMSLSRQLLTDADTNGHGMHGLAYFRGESGNAYQLMLIDSRSTPTLAPFLVTSTLLPGEGQLLTSLRKYLKLGVDVAIRWIPPLSWFLHQSMGVNICNLSPFSEGTVRLRSADWADPPRVDPKYMSDERDVAAAREAINAYRQMQNNSPSAKKVLGLELVPGFLYGYAESESGFKRWVRDFTFSYFHPVGTCRMGVSKEDAVVDHDLRVFGVQGLRVADASIAPNIPTAGPMGMIVMVGEMAADIISRDM